MYRPSATASLPPPPWPTTTPVKWPTDSAADRVLYPARPDFAALSDAARTISAELAPSSVEVRMVGRDPDLVVSVPSAEAEPTLLCPSRPAGTRTAPILDPDDETVARVSLRLPQSVKARVDEVAAADGISTNAWLIRAVMDALSTPAAAPSGRSPRVHQPAGTRRDFRSARPVRAAWGLQPRGSLRTGRFLGDP